MVIPNPIRVQPQHYWVGLQIQNSFQPVYVCWFSRGNWARISILALIYWLNMSSAGPRAKLWLNQRPQRGCVFTQIWFLPSNSPFSASPGQENHQNCEKMISNLIPKQNSAWKVQISRGESCSKRFPRHMRKMPTVDPTPSKLNIA